MILRPAWAIQQNLISKKNQNHTWMKESSLCWAMLVTVTLYLTVMPKSGLDRAHLDFSPGSEALSKSLNLSVPCLPS